MSMRFRDRDFSKKPLLRKDTQIVFPVNCLEDVPSPVQQHHNQGGRLDTAKIVANAFKTGVITHTREAHGRYIDATAITDFRESMSVKARADEAFKRLPDHIRKKQFENDPKQFVAYCLDEANIDKLREWGLAAPLNTPPAPKPVEVFITNPEPKGEGSKGS